ncbi:MAG TPA: DNA gyrase subunit A [Candidatus Merdivicinus intestinigallinarum]|nr:DNA gyrase subunit A [Candidatus Merdivicinus intestinigallinarum]
MRTAFLDYSMSVIVSRALPDVRDGLKPVHRRIVYTMHEAGLTPDKPFKKCATTVGDVLGKYHPHGDASVYDALVRLGQDFSLRYPLVDKHGNFGTIDGDPPAAYRYTEARMSKMALYMVADINKDTIDYDSNYDDSLKEPRVLPSRFPNLLVNGSTGIAVGMATNIPPHNLREVIDACVALIRNPDLGLEGLMEHIQGPDFPTGGIIMGRSGIRAAYATGRGKITLRARTNIEEDSKGRSSIVVTEIPYMINKTRILENVAALVKDGRIPGISFIRDESDREGMRIVFELKRDAIPQVVLNQLFSYSSLQETVGVIMLALVNGQPKILTLKDMLRHYLDFQAEVITRRTRFDLNKALERAHILEGLKRAVDIVDEIIATIRACKGGQPEAKKAIMEKFGFDDPQASAIVAFRLGQLAGLEILKIEEELNGLHARITEMQEILGDHNKVMEIVAKELLEIKEKFGDERRTDIQTVSGEVDIEDLIPREDCVVTLTEKGYVKRQPADVYKIQKRGGRGVSGMKQKDEDIVQEMFICSSHDNMLFLTTKGRMFKLKCYEIPEGSRSSMGSHINNLLALEPEEQISAMMSVPGFDPGKYVVMVTRRGLIKRTRLDAYKNIRKNGLNAITLNENDELVFSRLTNGECQLLIATRGGMIIRFDENDVREMSRTAMGVKAIRLKDGDEVVGMARVREGASVMTVTDKGLGRRTALEDYPVQSRNGLGKINYKVSEEKGTVCGIKVVDDTDDLIMISNDGVIIRIAVADVRLMSRYASGVRVMRLGENDRVVTFVRAEHAEDEETEKIEDSQEEDSEAAEAEALERELEADDAANPQEEEPEAEDPGDEEEPEE